MTKYIYASNGEPLANANREISLTRRRIVQCRDCVHYETDEVCDGCTLFDFADCSGSMADKFCAWGEMAENIIIGESYKQPSENDGEVIKNGGQYKFDGEAHTAVYAPYPLSVKANNPQGEVFVTGLTLHDGAERSKTEHDTREKLEADVHQFANPSGRVDNIGAHWEKRMLGFLDRQEAITTSELCGDYTYMKADRDLKVREAQELQAKIDKLTAERDKLQAENKRLRDSEACVGCEVIGGQIEELTAERDELREESKRKAKNYLHTIIELTAERDKLQAELKQERLEWESERDYADQCEKRVEKLTAECDKLREYGKYCLNNHVDYETEYLPTVKEFEAQVKDLETERDELQAELDACKLRERVAEDYDFRAAAQRWAQAFEDKCCEVIRLQETLDAMENGQFYAMYRAKCEECERLKRKLEKGGSDDEG